MGAGGGRSLRCTGGRVSIECDVVTAVEGTDGRSSEETLLNYLFDGYNPTARPVFNSSLTVAVNLRFSLLQIQDLVILYTAVQSEIHTGCANKKQSRRKSLLSQSL